MTENRTNPYPDEQPDAWSVYQYKEFTPATEEGRAAMRKVCSTPCGRVVPCFVLVRIAGPYPTEQRALEVGQAKYRGGYPMWVVPDTGPLFSFKRQEGN